MEQRISIERLEQAVNIFGSFDSNIRLLEQEFHVTVVNRDGEIRVEGEPEDTMLAVKAIQTLLTLSSRGEAIGEQNVRYVIGLVRSGKEAQITSAWALALVASRSRFRSMYHHWPSSTS